MKKQNNFKKAISSAYLHKVKKQMICPCCKEGKLVFYSTDNLWKCEMCGYQLNDELLTNGYTFWFCDECGVFLNNQEGFSYEEDKNICTHCGYENDTSEHNKKGICSDCGKLLDNPESSICEECKKIRLNKAGKNILKIVAGAAAFAAASYGAYKLINTEEAKKIINNLGNNNLNISSDDVVKTIEEAAKNVDVIPEKTIYRTKSWDGYGKQNYYCNVYKRIGDEVVKYKEHTFKFFDGKENNWINELNELERWSIDDPSMPDWLNNYI